MYEWDVKQPLKKKKKTLVFMQTLIYAKMRHSNECGNRQDIIVDVDLLR